jgi:hypothetical protein
LRFVSGGVVAAVAVVVAALTLTLASPVGSSASANPHVIALVGKANNPDITLRGYHPAKFSVFSSSGRLREMGWWRITGARWSGWNGRIATARGKAATCGSEASTCVPIGAVRVRAYRRQVCQGEDSYYNKLRLTFANGDIQTATLIGFCSD